MTSVCLSGPKSRTERPRKTKIGTEVAHVTRDSDTTFKVKKVKGQGHQAALLTAVLARQAAAAVGVRTCWPWETAATLPSARRRKALRRPRGRRRGAGAYRGGRARLQLDIVRCVLSEARAAGAGVRRRMCRVSDDARLPLFPRDDQSRRQRYIIEHDIYTLFSFLVRVGVIRMPHLAPVRDITTVHYVV